MECPFCQSQISQYAQRCYCCGENIPSGQHLLEESGIIEPKQGPSSPPLPNRNPGRYRFARLGDRFMAFVLDTAFLFGIFAVVDAWLFMRLAKFDGTELQLTTASLLTAIFANAAILFLYGWLLEASLGATLGKVLVGIRVIATNHRGPWSACAMRNLLRIVDGLGFYLVGTVVAACSGVRQRIGDFYAGTAVIEEGFGTAIRIGAVVLWVASLAGAGWAVPRICATNNPVHLHYLGQTVIRVGATTNSAYFRIAGISLDIHSAKP